MAPALMHLLKFKFMDIPVQRRPKKLKILIPTALTIVALTSVYLFIKRSASELNVKSSDLTISKVFSGKFEDLLIVTAQAQSLHSSLVNVVEGGAVKEIYAEDGQMIRKGDSLALISNPNTSFNYMNQENSIMQQINQMQSDLINLRNQNADREKEILQEQNEYDIVAQQYNLQKRLYEAEIGKKADYEISLEKWNYYQKRLKLSKANYYREQQATKGQIKELIASIVRMQESMNTLSANRNNFLIRAPADGRLSSFNISLGQSLNSGQNIGKIDLMDGYKLVAKVDEFYNNKLKTGIEGLLEANEKTYKVFVSKILPEINGGQFEIELLFKQALPGDIKIGMSFALRLYLSASRRTLLIDKGNFFKETNGQWIFVLNGNKAIRRSITIERENLSYYEISKGLKPGEEVIVSDYADFKKFKQLNIKQTTATR